MKFKKTRDDSTELNLLLKHKNQSILEKQDYEIYTATLRERNRIAREIHDNVGHMLSRSILMMGALKAINQQPILEQPLSQLEDTLNGAMNSVRQSVHDLHDDSIDLKIVIENLVNDFDFCDISLDYDLHKELPRELKYSFISIAKEALANIMKHSNATKVQITMREHPGLYQLIIKDNGTMTASITTSGISSVTSSTTASGIGSMISNATTSGIGLMNIQERVGLLHGTLHIIRNTGFELFITIPKERI